MGLLAYLRTRFVGDREASMSGLALRSVVLDALANLSAAASDVTRVSGELSAALAHVAASPWKHTASSLHDWAEGVHKVLPVAKEYFFSLLICTVDEVAESVAVNTPKWDHLISDNSYVKPLAKKQLLDWPGRKQLSAKVIDLFHVLSDASKTFCALGLGRALEDHPTYKGSVNAAQKVFQAGKICVKIIAYVNVIQSLTGDDQKSAAAPFNQKVDLETPASLTKEIALICSRKVGGGKQKASGSASGSGKAAPKGT